MTQTRPHILSQHALRKAEKHLRHSDEIMSTLVSKHGPCPLAKHTLPPFQTLVTSIIGQQLSAKAADTIEARVMRVVGVFDPDAFLNVPIENLTRAGLSAAKTRYILELARRVHGGQIKFSILSRHPDDKVIASLTELPGIGQWTAKMFLIFGLRRADVLAIDDAGLQRAARTLYGPSAQLQYISKPWRPYCSVASWYLWKHLDTD
jgi:DNA-3-methyladenine glycosylase II